MTTVTHIAPFLGLNQATSLSLKPGQAEEMENFTIDSQGRLTLRPAAVTLSPPFCFDPAQQELVGLWAGFLGGTEYLAVAVCPKSGQGSDYIQVFRQAEGGLTEAGRLFQPFRQKVQRVHFFTFCGQLYALSAAGLLRITDRGLSSSLSGPAFTAAAVSGYVPLVLTGASPDGAAGTPLEDPNLLTGLRRVSFDADGTARYRLPQEAAAVESVRVGGTLQENAGTFSAASHAFTFTQAPAQGVGNVEITYSIADNAQNLSQVLSMSLSEVYNGDTDTRLFLYGDGSSRCLYSGITLAGEPDCGYFPAGNVLQVDGGEGPLTGLIRHGSQLLAFKADGAWSIVYDAVTLPDGTVTAGFYLRPLHRSLGNLAPGQVTLVENAPRTFTTGALYDWLLPSGYYRDERSARCVSQRVAPALAAADPQKLLAFDDNCNRTWYLFLNDQAGTVLVHAYGPDVWCRYTGAAFRGVRHAVSFGGGIVFAGAGTLYRLDKTQTWDLLPAKAPIKALWRSGWLHLGTPWAKKYTRTVWLHLLPEPHSRVRLTARTDRLAPQEALEAAAPSVSYQAADYAAWTYLWAKLPRPLKLRLRLKKFAYCQLLLRVDTPGAAATVEAIEIQ